MEEVRTIRDVIDEALASHDMTDAIAALLEIERILDAADEAAMNAPGKVGRKHPETSRKAAKPPKRGEKMKILVRLFRVPDGLTARELWKSYHGNSPNQTATRLGELEELEMVRRTEVERQTTKGNTGHVYVLTPYGRAYLLAHWEQHQDG